MYRRWVLLLVLLLPTTLTASTKITLYPNATPIVTLFFKLPPPVLLSLTAFAQQTLL